MGTWRRVLFGCLSLYPRHKPGTGLERLLRYCVRPLFALEHLHTLDAGHLIYHNPKPRSDNPRDLVLTPQLIDKIAALIPPPRVHRHRYCGVLAPIDGGA